MSSKRKAEATSGGNAKKTTASTKKKTASTTTAAAVSNFFKPASQKEPEATSWRVMSKTLLVGRYMPKGREDELNKEGKVKVAGFDLDSTLITTVSGNKFAKDATDWKWWDPCVPSHLKTLHASHHQLVIFTNQAGIPDPAGDSARLTAFKTKLAAIFNALDLPGILVYAATANDRFRKPRPGMWQELLDDLDLDGSDPTKGVDLEGSYLIGDAAGREGDFSDTDRNWALNLHIGFKTPEEFFLSQEPRPMSVRFDPAAYMSADDDGKLPFTPETEVIELVLLSGSPGAGKSTFYRRHMAMHGYAHVNQDSLKTKGRCLSAARTFLKGGKSVVVDNTNADVDTRKLWIDLAKELGVPIRCVVLAVDEAVCVHNAAVRAFGGSLVNPEKREMLPRMAFSGFKGRWVEPMKEEGFAEVMRVGWRWEGGEEERGVWGRYWN